MKTEREMLQYAAKACGIHIDYSTTNGGGAGNTGFDIMGNVVTNWHDGETWNPLTNSADCAEMCAKLDINSMYALTAPLVSCWKEGVGDTTTTHYNENHDGTDKGKETAWRYAATQVAAKIGGMK